MENWMSYTNPQAFFLIRLFYRLLLAFIVLLVLLFLFLSIQDTVSFKEGEIYSTQPQIKLATPQDVQVHLIRVKEGQQVRTGDTLFVLEHKKYQSDFLSMEQEIVMLKEKITLLRQVYQTSGLRKQALQQSCTTQQHIFQVDTQKLTYEKATIHTKMQLLHTQSSLTTDKFRMDSVLYLRKAISKTEWEETRHKKIADMREQLDIQAAFAQKTYDLLHLKTTHQKAMQTLAMELYSIENQMQNYQKEILELQTQLHTKQYQRNYLTNELQKLVIVAPVDGTVSSLYNTHQTNPLLNKGELLAIIAPLKESFYAKITLSEQDLAYVSEGQDVHLKMAAYEYYTYGIVKGKVAYISPSDVNKTFYTLVKITVLNPHIRLKAGYKLKGEVIVEQMKLYQYTFKKLFQKLDKGIHG